MALQIQLSTDFNTSAVNFSKFRKNKNGGKAVYLNSGSGSLLIQLPYMRAPFGLSSFTDEASGKTSYSLDLSLDTSDNEVAQFYDKLNELDDLVLDTVLANSKEWLGKDDFNKAELKKFCYKPLVRPSKGDYPANLKLKILTDLKTGDFIAEAYNSQRNRVSMDSIEKGQKIMAIVDFNSIWFIDNKFGITPRLKQCLLAPSKKLPSFAFKGVPEPQDDEECDDVASDDGPLEDGEIDM